MALKLDSLGLVGYNMVGIDYESLSPDGKTSITELYLSDDTSRGVFLDDMYAKTRGYFNNPLYFRPLLFLTINR